MKRRAAKAVSAPQAKRTKTTHEGKAKKQAVEDEYDMGDEVWNEGEALLESYDFTEDPPPAVDVAVSAMAKLYRENGVRHTKIVNTTDGNIIEYPEKSDRHCLGCRKKITTIPILSPVVYNEKAKYPWTVELQHHCSLICAVETIISRRKSDMGSRLSLLARFSREFFGMDIDNLTQVSIECVEGFCDKPVMTMEQYYKSCGVITVLLSRPTCMFVETWVEERDVIVKEEQRKNEFEKLLNMKPTAEQQSKFRDTIQRIVQENKVKKTSIETSDLGRTLGIKQTKP